MSLAMQNKTLLFSLDDTLVNQRAANTE
ncbi:hypothetical protein SE957_13525 [Escherichia coli]|nr:hypothetical protein [Escherichia coli]